MFVHPDMVILGRDDVQGIDEGLIAHADFRQKEKKTRKERVGKSIDVDYMRIIGTWLSQRPWEAKRRVAVIVDAERMNLSAANAFLKGLEEPAPGAVAFLTSSAPAFLRPTIRSRCAAIRLSGVPQDLVEAHLIAAGVEPADAHVRALASAGSISRAMQTRPPLDDLRDQILLALSGGKEAALAAFNAATMAGGKDTDRDHTLHLFATLLRDIAVVQTGGSAEPLIHDSVREAIARAAQTPIDPFDLFTKVVAARERVTGNANRVLLWDDLLHDATSGG
jgi:DNA polymerase-3 subunit delta'